MPDPSTPHGPPPSPLAPARALRLGVCGPVGTGKSSLIALLCRELSERLELGVVTNDIYTDEDARFLRSAGVLDADRIRAVETGACPHTAIRDDITANAMAIEELEEDYEHRLEMVLVESGGDNLTATFSPALVDVQVFVLDVAGGGLVVNKTDLGPFVGVDVPQMVADATAARGDRPVIGLSRTDRDSIDRLLSWVAGRLAEHRAGNLVPIDPGPMAAHSHAHEHPHEHPHAHADTHGGEPVGVHHN